MGEFKIRDVAWACAEKALAERHEVSRGEQIRLQAKTAKLIGALRYLPTGLLKGIVDLGRHDTIPLHRGDVAARALAYGGEATVFEIELPSDEKAMLKLYLGRENAMAIYKSLKRNEALYRRCFGDLVVPVHHFVYESQYGTGEAYLAGIQQKIDGEWLFAHPTRVKPAALQRLYDGTWTMDALAEVLPDFIGKDNVLVDSEGEIHIIDYGQPIGRSNDMRMQKLTPRLTQLSELVQAANRLAS